MSLRLCSAGFNFLVAACVRGLSLSLPGVRWPLAGVRRVGVALSHGCGRVSSLSGAFGGLRGLNPPLVSLVLVLWCALVHRAVSCRALPCCAVLVCAVLQCALLCRAVPRPIVLWCVVPWLGWLRRAVPRRAVSCCGVSCRGVPCCAALHGGAPRCGVPCCLVSCRIAVPWCVVGPSHCRSGGGWGRGWLDWPVSWCMTWAEAICWLVAGGHG